MKRKILVAIGGWGVVVSLLSLGLKLYNYYVLDVPNTYLFADILLKVVIISLWAALLTYAVKSKK